MVFVYWAVLHGVEGTEPTFRENDVKGFAFIEQCFMLLKIVHWGERILTFDTEENFHTCFEVNNTTQRLCDCTVRWTTALMIQQPAAYTNFIRNMFISKQLDPPRPKLNRKGSLPIQTRLIREWRLPAVCATPYMCHALYVPRPISAPCPTCAMRYMCNAL